MLHPSVRNLLFCGHVITITAPLTFSVQAAWLGEYLLGNITLPSSDTMRAKLASQCTAMARDRFPSPLSGKSFNVHGDQYHDALMREMHVDHLARYGGLFGAVANCVLPQKPALCEQAVQHGARHSRQVLQPPRGLKLLVVFCFCVVTGRQNCKRVGTARGSVSR